MFIYQYMAISRGFIILLLIDRLSTVSRVSHFQYLIQLICLSPKHANDKSCGGLAVSIIDKQSRELGLNPSCTPPIFLASFIISKFTFLYIGLLSEELLFFFLLRWVIEAIMILLFSFGCLLFSCYSFDFMKALLHINVVDVYLVFH